MHYGQGHQPRHALTQPDHRCVGQHHAQRGAGMLPEWLAHAFTTLIGQVSPNFTPCWQNTVGDITNLAQLLL